VLSVSKGRGLLNWLMQLTIFFMSVINRIERLEGAYEYTDSKLVEAILSLLHITKAYKEGSYNSTDSYKQCIKYFHFCTLQ